MSQSCPAPFNLPEKPFQRRIRSFVSREGRLSEGQRHALETSPYLIDPTSIENVLHWESVFGCAGEKRVLELGFGDGESLLQMALAAPNTQFIGIEVYRSGVGSLLRQVNLHGVQNIRVMMGDASLLLSLFETASVDVVQLFFPDPWHKKRHHKRRLFQIPFARVLASKLREGGILHLASDWEGYARDMLSVIEALPELNNLAPNGDFIPRPAHRPLTKYERRGLRLGHLIRDIQCCKQAVLA